MHVGLSVVKRALKAVKHDLEKLPGAYYDKELTWKSQETRTIVAYKLVVLVPFTCDEGSIVIVLHYRPCTEVSQNRNKRAAVVHSLSDASSKVVVRSRLCM